jgi:hypothetical protein
MVGLQRMDLDRRGAARLAAAQHAVGEQGHAQHMIEVRVREQDVVDAGERLQGQVAHAGAASIRTSSSSRKLVVRQSRAMEPEQPRTWSFMRASLGCACG